MSQAPPESPPRDYASALRLLYDRINFEKQGHSPYTSQHYRLDRMREILARLGSPHVRYPILHVAGTKGKGTTATLLHDALVANALRVGLYTSPHLVQLEERFRVNSQPCSPAELVELTGQVAEVANQVEASGWGRPTFFELTTAMGLLHFARRAVDCVVLEVGLGGRLDSTNVCQPLLSIITSISLDHQAQLGNDIRQIAAEKAGIIKPDVPVICTARDPLAREVIEQVAARQGAPLLLLDRDFSIHWQSLDSARSAPAPDAFQAVAQVRYRSSVPLADWAADSRWFTRLLGRHQADNLAGAITALGWLASRGHWPLDPPATLAAIEKSHAPARLQIVGRNPVQIIDTAHNPGSIAAALSAVADHFCDPALTVVFASSRDKDYRSMLRQILPRCQRLICTAFVDNPRAVAATGLYAAANEIAGQLQQDGIPMPVIEQLDNPLTAWQRGLELCPPEGLIIAMGSFFLAADLFASRRDGLGVQ